MTMPRVFQINVSDGGVPKRPVRRVRITFDGVAGDRQQHTEFHGGPDRAVCLYSLERILALQTEGHPIFPGATGENLTISGLQWEALAPGARLQVGPDLVLEIVSYTTPCRLIAESFLEGHSQRIFQDRHPGWSRLYARVLEPGDVSIGDVVNLNR